MPEVIWRAEALADLDHIVDYIGQFDPDAAERYDAALRAPGNSLCDFPDRGRPAAHGTREMTTLTPYILAYRDRVDEDEVDILSIRHSRRQPRD